MLGLRLSLHTPCPVESICAQSCFQRLANRCDNIKTCIFYLHNVGSMFKQGYGVFHGSYRSLYHQLHFYVFLPTCQKFYGSHTGESIYRSYEQVILEFKIKKISAVVTDSASNMVKAFTLSGYSVDIDEEEDLKIIVICSQQQ